jgi:hypothetical protein
LYVAYFKCLNDRSKTFGTLVALIFSEEWIGFYSHPKSTRPPENKMKSIVLTLIAAVAALSSASALTIASPQYVGKADPGTPSSPAGEVAYINELITMAPNTSAEFAGNTLIRSGNTFGALPNAIVTGSDKTDGEDFSPTFDVTGWSYVVGKYGNDSYIWFVGGLTGNLTLDSSITGSGGLSHISWYNPGDTPRVPDGGATLLLLGAALSGLGMVRRSSKKD